MPSNKSGRISSQRARKNEKMGVINSFKKGAKAAKPKKEGESAKANARRSTSPANTNTPASIKASQGRASIKRCAPAPPRPAPPLVWRTNRIEPRAHSPTIPLLAHAPALALGVSPQPRPFVSALENITPFSTQVISGPWVLTASAARAALRVAHRCLDLQRVLCYVQPGQRCSPRPACPALTAPAKCSALCP